MALTHVYSVYRESGYDRARHMPTAIERGDDAVGDYGDPLVAFCCPDMYASSSKPWKLQPAALDALEKAQAELLEAECSIILVDAYRPISQQEKRKAERPDLAVSPDASKHTRGLAIDARLFDPAVSSHFEGANSDTHGDQDYLAEVLGKHSWRRTNHREPWHFEYQGG